MLHGLLIKYKGYQKRESDFSYFHCGPFAPAASHSETPLGKHLVNKYKEL